jgi:hypothetical protein
MRESESRDAVIDHMATFIYLGESLTKCNVDNLTMLTCATSRVTHGHRASGI